MSSAHSPKQNKVTDSKEIADSINSFFTGIAQQCVKNCDTSQDSHQIIKNYIKEKLPSTETFKIPDID